MNLNFTKKVIVITGGTAGIGLAIAKKFGSLGGNVSICSRSEKKLKKAVEDLKNKNINVHSKIVDVSNKENLFKYADEVEEKFGSIDIWINNAGIYPQYKIIDTPEDVWDKTINVNLKAIYYGALISKSKMKKGGVLINASSFAAVMPSVGSGLYAATKAAVSSMTKTLAAELAPMDIRVVGYIPGVIKTDMTNDLIDLKGDEMKKVIALNRFGEAEDVANYIAFLASEYASYVTGTCVEISGGKFCVQNPNSAWEKNK